MLLVHKIKLKPNNKQTTYFKKSAGVARFAYNWGLSQWKEQYAAGGKPNVNGFQNPPNFGEYLN